MRLSSQPGFIRVSPDPDAPLTPGDVDALRNVFDLRPLVIVCVKGTSHEKAEPPAQVPSVRSSV